MPFEKGDKHINRGGRPKGKSVRSTLEDMLEEEVQGMTKREALCKKILSLAFAGDSWAMREVFDRVDGKPKQAIDQTITTDAPPSIHLVIRGEQEDGPAT